MSTLSCCLVVVVVMAVGRREQVTGRQVSLVSRCHCFVDVILSSLSCQLRSSMLLHPCPLSPHHCHLVVIILG